MVDITKVETLTPELFDELILMLTEDVSDGHTSALKRMAQIKFLSDVLDAAKAEIEPSVLSELSHYSDKEKPKICGFYKVQKREADVKFDYGVCNHPGWLTASEELKKADQKKKEIEQTLKTLKQPQTLVDEETGEIHQINPPVKTSKTVAVFTKL